MGPSRYSRPPDDPEPPGWLVLALLGLSLLAIVALLSGMCG